MWRSVNRQGRAAYLLFMRRGLPFFLVLLLSPILVLAADAPLLVVLTDTGREREGLPVLALHPAGGPVAAQLDRGLSGDLLRIYRLLQVRLHRTRGTAVEPAYLLLSTRQGGFARFGFWLGDDKKNDVPFVDVHRDWEISGRFGAIDQIFPHELAHAIFRQLAGENPESGGANQVHAVGVKTDRFTAFNEGFAEHLQVMAVDHPDAVPATRALANAHDLDEAARRHLASYRRELSAPFAPVARMRVGFPLWYSGDERVLRYFAVKRNAFAREARIPVHLLTRRDRYPAYLLENMLPGDEGAPAKPIARLTASEGALSTFFHRWATNTALQQRYRDASFYALFGTTAGEVTPLQNVYLKLRRSGARPRGERGPDLAPEGDGERDEIGSRGRRRGPLAADHSHAVRVAAGPRARGGGNRVRAPVPAGTPTRRCESVDMADDLLRDRRGARRRAGEPDDRQRLRRGRGGGRSLRISCRALADLQNAPRSAGARCRRDLDCDGAACIDAHDAVGVMSAAYPVPSPRASGERVGVRGRAWRPKEPPDRPALRHSC